ncbi:MAG: hypothetical protein DWI22_22820 [Planctomycetota bacterium]|nr:MAG: hypothetical protein DWI22_22820 [Planctomycetota bacterium]
MVCPGLINKFQNERTQLSSPTRCATTTEANLNSPEVGFRTGETCDLPFHGGTGQPIELPRTAFLEF